MMACIYTHSSTAVRSEYQTVKILFVVLLSCSSAVGQFALLTMQRPLVVQNAIVEVISC